MGLNYILTDVRDAAELADDDVMIMTHALMFIGMPSIDGVNGKYPWQKVTKRLHIWQSAYGPLMRTEDGEEVAIVPSMVRRFIGLRTNAEAFTDAQFRARVFRRLEENAELAFEAWKKAGLDTD